MVTKEELAKIVDDGYILDDPETLNAYCQDNSLAPPRRSRAVVKLQNANQVPGIVNWANQTGTPLVPVSSGPPHFRGDTVPSIGGAVIVDLSEMKQIVRIDSRNRIVIIEPGVTFDQLLPELAKEGLRLTIPLCPRRNKSVIASCLEREPMVMPRYHWDLIEPLRCLGVVWGDGTSFTTGEQYQQVELGAYVPEELWQETSRAHVDGTGPVQMDYHRLLSGAQGSLGIVSWASLRCQLLPQVQRLFLAPAKRLDDLLDFAYQLLRLRYGDELMLLNSSSLASILGDEPSQIEALIKELPPWFLIVVAAGHKYAAQERAAAQEADIKDMAQQSHLRLETTISGIEDKEVLAALSGPSKPPYWKLRHQGGCQEIFFLTTLDRTTEFVGTMYSVAEEMGYPPADIGIYIQPLQHGVSCHCEFILPYNPDAPGEVAMVQELMPQASQTLLDQGAFFSRPYGAWADMVYKRDAASTIISRAVKEIFDPNNILNPGKLCF